MLLRDHPDDLRPFSAPAAAACVALITVFVHLAYHTMRGQGAWGMDPSWTQAATAATFLLVFLVGWVDRLRARRRG